MELRTITHNKKARASSGARRCLYLLYARFIRLKKVMSMATATPSALLQLCAGGRTGAQARVSRAPLITEAAG
eukprot:scaffold100759_cov78-Phaeocystis_antarctica.AAC.2